ncbi:RHS repeat-associated core domain-containing protein [Poriferisphaera corsica]|uniref:RHS repeat-associated core domain-containing protein n=1 Tax=Poriferisphaera corsica TaxID=2528020 RepID=UPI00119E4DB2
MTGNPLSTSAYNNPYGFTGRRYDSKSKLYHDRRRAYSPELGRFLQRDPAGYVDGYNLYAYVRNTPPRFIDPSSKAIVEMMNQMM